MSDELKQSIIERAQKLFYQYGIRSITMDFIASEMGMSKRTLYEYFKNKDALIIACMEMGRKAQENDMTEIFNSDTNTIEKLVRCYNRIIYYISATSRSFQHDVQQMRSKVNEEAAKYKKKQFEYFRRILSIGVEEGLIRPEMNLDIVTTLHNAHMELLGKIEIDGAADWNYADLLATHTKLFLYGIVTGEGRKVLDENYEQINNNQ